MVSIRAVVSNGGGLACQTRRKQAEEVKQGGEIMPGTADCGVKKQSGPDPFPFELVLQLFGRRA